MNESLYLSDHMTIRDFLWLQESCGFEDSFKTQDHRTEAFRVLCRHDLPWIDRFRRIYYLF